MSALPLDSPSRRRIVPPAADSRHIEIVSTRQHRRARPRLVIAVITVGGLFGILAIQLLLSIATSEGAYEIAALQARQSELARDEQALVEQLNVLEAPQQLAMQAQSLGMVPSTGAAYLIVADGSVLGVPRAATASSALMTAPDGSPLVADALLADLPLVTDPRSGTAPTGTSAGAPGTVGAPPSVASNSPAGIPSPLTH